MCKSVLTYLEGTQLHSLILPRSPLRLHHPMVAAVGFQIWQTSDGQCVVEAYCKPYEGYLRSFVRSLHAVNYMILRDIDLQIR